MNDIETATKPMDLLKQVKIDLREAARTLDPDEARYVVDLYYQIQDYRLCAQGQVRAAMVATCPECRKDVSYHIRKRPKRQFVVAKHPVTGEPDNECVGTDEPVVPKTYPNALVSHVFEAFDSTEDEIANALDHYTENQPIAAWMRSIVGIGPIISAGLIAHVFHLDPFPVTAAHLWSFAGLNPGAKWEKGSRRPWNARLKVLTAYKLGESFVKVQNKEDDVYGHLYAKRKALETAKNERGEFAEQAKQSLARLKKEKTSARLANEAGTLAKGHIHARARRWTVKLFLSHFFTVARWMRPLKAWHVVDARGTIRERDSREAAEALIAEIEARKTEWAKHLAKLGPYRVEANPRAGEQILGPAPYAIEHLGHADVIPIPNVHLVPGLAEALRKTNRRA